MITEGQIIIGVMLFALPFGVGLIFLVKWIDKLVKNDKGFDW